MKPLVFAIKEIEALKKGLDVEQDLSKDLLRTMLADAIEDDGADPERSQAHLKANLTVHGANVHCRGRLRGALSLQCKRCLEEATAPVDADLHLTFVPINLHVAHDEHRGHDKAHDKSHSHGKPAVEPRKKPHGKDDATHGKHAHKGDAAARGPAAVLVNPDDPDDLDYGHHDREVVDLAGIVREYLLLSIPITVLCRPDCQGLCPSCGVDLNKTQCGCTEQVSLSPFAALKNLDLNRS